MKVGVIVARFQASRLTPAHISLITHALKHNDRVVIFIGESRTKLSIKNPLPVSHREAMIKDAFGFGTRHKIYTMSIKDSKSDKLWSDFLDSMIDGYTTSSDDEVIIYSGRDGFAQYYSGKHKVEVVSLGIDDVSATKIREEIHNTKKSTEDFREGIIFASNHRYPVSLVSFMVINPAIYCRIFRRHC